MTTVIPMNSKIDMEYVRLEMLHRKFLYGRLSSEDRNKVSDEITDSRKIIDDLSENENPTPAQVDERVERLRRISSMLRNILRDAGIYGLRDFKLDRDSLLMNR